MARLSDIIEEFIKQLLNNSQDDILEIQRNELANKFSCAPSQINYVLMTRFTVDRGYYIESRRGGGGSIRITRVSLDNNAYFKDLISDRIGQSISQSSAESYIDAFLEQNLITPREAALMKAAVNDKAINIQSPDKDSIRASLLKSMLIVLLY
ncbi:transcriptional regulator CtsR [Oxobacter pfennigii]|uniref:Transcriptional regulator CtsR n=1 Tax=Oxobacter pfennigii TaxID=36849 RepID=A0A0P9AC44_9CLOT|nr:CtsR family transcriptional regulator [Oxobacter pfennigii]KPU42666.1 transcriptional regulator CtsR [Oxobacter pfennigii]